MSAIIVNLFGAPGAGKSTAATYIFSRLKMLGVNCEYISEFAKDKVWEKNNEALDCQEFIFGSQAYKIKRCVEQVDVIITDSPLLLSVYYDNGRLGKNFKPFVIDVFNTYNNKNYYLDRVKEYNPIGRLQTEKESDKVAIELRKFLDDNLIFYTSFGGIKSNYDIIVKQVSEELKKQGKTIKRVSSQKYN